VCQQTCQNHCRRCHTRCGKPVWPSGPRRWLKAREGVGSNPTAVIFCDVADAESRNQYWQFHSSATSHKPSPVRLLQLPMVCLIIKAPLSLFSWGESGWCSDVTSTHAAWRHAGIRFLLLPSSNQANPGAVLRVSGQCDRVIKVTD
jgi:hypothetical protein